MSTFNVEQATSEIRALGEKLEVEIQDRIIQHVEDLFTDIIQLMNEKETIEDVDVLALDVLLTKYKTGLALAIAESHKSRKLPQIESAMIFFTSVENVLFRFESNKDELLKLFNSGLFSRFSGYCLPEEITSAISAEIASATTLNQLLTMSSQKNKSYSKISRLLLLKDLDKSYQELLGIMAYSGLKHLRIEDLKTCSDQLINFLNWEVLNTHCENEKRQKPLMDYLYVQEYVNEGNNPNNVPLELGCAIFRKIQMVPGPSEIMSHEDLDSEMITYGKNKVHYTPYTIKSIIPETRFSVVIDVSFSKGKTLSFLGVVYEYLCNLKVS